MRIRSLMAVDSRTGRLPEPNKRYQTHRAVKKMNFWFGFWEESLREICWGFHLISPFLASSRNWATTQLGVRMNQFSKNTIHYSITIRQHVIVKCFWHVKKLPPILASCDFSVDRFRHAARRVHLKWGLKDEWKFFHSYIWAMYDK